MKNTLLSEGINIVDSNFKRVNSPSCFTAGGAAATI
jgi:hypothetical protein